MLNLHTLDDPEDLIIAYQKTPSIFFDVASRLLLLKKQGYFIIIWNKEIENLQKDSKKLIQTLSLINSHSKDLCEAGEADSLIRSLLDLSAVYGNTFETYKICCTISELVQNKRQFPSKATAILYFQRIAAMFKISHNGLSYLNALHLLNELQPVTISKKEVECMKKLAIIRSETVCKELFCGVKLRNVDSIVVGLDDSDFMISDPILENILSFNIGDKVESKYIPSLMKYSINFEVESEGAKIIRPSNESFTSVIFNIANRYNNKTNDNENNNEKMNDNRMNDNKKSINKPNDIVKSNDIKPNDINKAVKKNVNVFKNRFTIPYKKSKLIKMHCKLEFEDINFEERNRKRELRITELMNKKEEDRNNLIQYKSVVESLLVELARKIEERNEKERQEMLERARQEEEKALKERTARMWRNSQTEPTNSSTVEINKNEGIYVSKFNTMNFTESNILRENSNNEGIYVPKFTTMSFIKGNNREDINKK